jgi:hypothetical protein
MLFSLKWGQIIDRKSLRNALIPQAFLFWIVKMK